MTTKVIKVRLSWSEAEAMLREGDPTRYEYGIYSKHIPLWDKLIASIKKTFPEGIELIKQQEKAWEIVQAFSRQPVGDEEEIKAISRQIDELRQKADTLFRERSDKILIIQQEKFDEAGITYFKPGDIGTLRMGGGNSLRWTEQHPEVRKEVQRCQTRRNKSPKQK